MFRTRIVSCVKPFALLAVVCVAITQELPAKAGPWNVQLGPAVDPSGPFAKVRLPKTAFKGDDPRGFALSLPSAKAVVCCSSSTQGKDKKTKIFLCDLTAGRITQQTSVDGAFIPLDFDASGTRVVVRSDHMGLGKKDTAELWKIATDGSLTVRRWVPYDRDSMRERDVLWAAFVGAGKLTTLSSGGQLVVWDVAMLKQLYSVESSPVFPALSPNKNYVAYLVEAKVGLLDVATGRKVGLIPLGTEVQSGAIAFRIDGRALVCATDDKIILVNVESGGSGAVSIPGISGTGLHQVPAVGWVDNRLLFVNNYLVDPEIPVPIWLYNGGLWTRLAGGRAWFLATKGMTDVGLVPLRLPHAAAVNRIAATQADSSSFLVKPGDLVQISVSKVPKEDQADARTALTAALQARDYKPASNASLVLEVLPGKESFQERVYKIYPAGPFGGFGGGDGKEQRQEKIRFRTQQAEIRLMKDGKVI